MIGRMPVDKHPDAYVSACLISLQSMNSKGGRDSDNLPGKPWDPATHDTHINLCRSNPHQALLRPQLGQRVWTGGCASGRRQVRWAGPRTEQ